MSKPVIHPLTSLPLPSNSDDSIWVFGYGSLIWFPGFKFTESHKAIVKGYHRSFCVWSTSYRGTVESPGLVMGLNNGGHCTGMAFNMDKNFLDEGLLYLFDREMDTNAYVPTICEVTLFSEDNQPARKVSALTFVVNHNSDCYAKNLSVEDKAKIIKLSQGARGPNTDYIINTHEHLMQMGIEDSYLKAICKLL